MRDELGKARPKVQHRRALPYAEVPAFVASLPDRQRATLATKLALLFVIYTACRSVEVRGARWSEIDAEARDQLARYRRIAAEMAALAPLRERWVREFFERITGPRGFSVHAGTRRTIRPEELPERPARPWRVVW